MPVPGDTLTRRISLFDANGAPINGATFSVQGRSPGGSVIPPLPVADLGHGIYEVSMPTIISDPQGSYYLQAVSDTVPPQVFEREWIVKPLGTPERWRPGDTVQDYITVIDPLANPVLGDTFTIRAFNTIGKEIPVAQPTELGNGIYRVSIATSRFDPPGTYSITLISNSLPLQVYEVEFVTGQPVNLTGGTTLRDLRRRIMAKFGDLIMCTATQPGTITTFIDEDNLVGEPSRYAGREALFITGMNAGQKRYVQGSSRDSLSITFQRPLPYPVLLGDQVDITNAFGLGVTFQAVDNAIREAIEVARTQAHVPVSYAVHEWDGEPIPVPADVVGISGVHGMDANDYDRHSLRGTHVGGGWRIDKSSRTIQLGGYGWCGWKGHDLVVNARALPNLLIDDDDVTMIDSEWLVSYASSQIALDTVMGRHSGGDWASKGMLWKKDAERLVTRLTPNIGPNYQSIG